jgi:hypothetical protein
MLSYFAKGLFYGSLNGEGQDIHQTLQKISCDIAKRLLALKLFVVVIH